MKLLLEHINKYTVKDKMAVNLFKEFLVEKDVKSIHLLFSLSPLRFVTNASMSSFQHQIYGEYLLLSFCISAKSIVFFFLSFGEKYRYFAGNFSVNNSHNNVLIYC